MELTSRLIDQLHIEAMLLADEARSYFDDFGRDERDRLSPLQRVGFSCESLKVTTRLMHVVAWLLSRRATESQAPLGAVADSDPTILEGLPEEARRIVAASEDLYARVARLDGKLTEPAPVANAARGLMAKLERAF